MERSRIGIIFVGLVLGFLLVKSFLTSEFLRARTRLNFIVYDKAPIYYSLDKKSGINYLMPLYADLKVQVPGGYGYYRLGGISKLVSLEQKPDIIRRVASHLSNSEVPFYFYPPKIEVYYGRGKPNLLIPNIYKLFIYSSNANLFDRLYIFIRLVGLNQNNFNILSNYGVKKIGGEDFFDYRGFSKKFSGYMYEEAYRTEDLTVQILYTKSYTAAESIGNILQGTGIKVVDLTQEEQKDCAVIESPDKSSKTARDIADFINCKVQKGQVEGYDIIIKLGPSQEKNWSINNDNS